MKRYNQINALVSCLVGSVAALIVAVTASAAPPAPPGGYDPRVECCTLEAWIEGKCSAVQPMCPECDPLCSLEGYLEGHCSFCPCTEDYIPPPQEDCCTLEAWIEGKCSAVEPVCEECDPACTPEAAAEGLCVVCECPDTTTAP